VSKLRNVLLLLLFCSSCGFAQTADELVSKNLQAKGGLEKIKAIHSLRTTGNLDTGFFKAVLSSESQRPDLYRTNMTVQGMTRVQAYDGATAWQISPFNGKKDPQLMGEDESRGLIEEADFDGPLVDAQAKGNKVEYLGHDQVDGDDAYKLKVTLKNGDILYYYLDPDTYLEIQIERQQFIRGSVRESVTLLGSYKAVNGVMYPFSIEAGPKNDPDSRARITIQKIEANVPVNEADFKMPAAASTTKNPPTK
jgi:outer membrane lipoprotein-sorting protein